MIINGCTPQEWMQAAYPIVFHLILARAMASCNEAPAPNELNEKDSLLPKLPGATMQQ